MIWLLTQWSDRWLRPVRDQYLGPTRNICESMKKTNSTGKMKKNMNSIFERKAQKASHPLKKYSKSLVVEL